jgi:hypothetical protein
MLAIALCLFVWACSAPTHSLSAFERWQAEGAGRGETFARFVAMLEAEGVASVVPPHELWLVDQHEPRCVSAPYLAPPEEEWRNIVPALRFIRDHVKPAVGAVRVQSGYRDETFNACVGGAPQSAHRRYYALDLVPLDAAISRADLIAILCPIHAAEGQRADVGMGIYRARRFHIDARGFRGWGGDFRGTSFPCTNPEARA